MYLGGIDHTSTTEERGIALKILIHVLKRDPDFCYRYLIEGMKGAPPPHPLPPPTTTTDETIDDDASQGSAAEAELDAGARPGPPGAGSPRAGPPGAGAAAGAAIKQETKSDSTAEINAGPPGAGPAAGAESDAHPESGAEAAGKKEAAGVEAALGREAGTVQSLISKWESMFEPQNNEGAVINAHQPRM